MSEATKEQTHTLKIEVNNQQVTIVGPKENGLQIKKAAIAQGVKIEEDFELSEELGEHKKIIITDDKIVSLHNGSKFTAVDGDDNS